MNNQIQLPQFDISVALLHDKMWDKTGQTVTTSVTLIDVHDIARSSRTFGATNLFISHPSQTMRALVRTVKTHWDTGFGSEYNPNRTDALSVVSIVRDLDEAIQQIDKRTGKLPKIIATSAHHGEGRTSYTAMKEIMNQAETPFLLLFGTGWGMSDELLSRADYLLDPIDGPTDYNHLSVRAAAAIILDRLLGR
jgi:hypothetical protein